MMSKLIPVAVNAQAITEELNCLEEELRLILKEASEAENDTIYDHGVNIKSHIDIIVEELGFLTRGWTQKDVEDIIDAYSSRQHLLS